MWCEEEQEQCGPASSLEAAAGGKGEERKVSFPWQQTWSFMSYRLLFFAFHNSFFLYTHTHHTNGRPEPVGLPAISLSFSTSCLLFHPLHLLPLAACNGHLYYTSSSWMLTAWVTSLDSPRGKLVLNLIFISGWNFDEMRALWELSNDWWERSSNRIFPWWSFLISRVLK